ncbi:MAG: D-alanyl-D-alanine carboxypeptidase [Glaciihabitans sp.]|nr:D-alanyl-D-alanine carboxypeptidase [Glaciihabitans sp.]
MTAGAIALIVVAGVMVGGVPHPVSASASAPPKSTTAGFDRSTHSKTRPSSPWVIVNKRHPMSPRNWAPSDLVTVKVAHANPPRMRAQAGAALVKLFAAARKHGGGAMQVQSAYRSYSTQVSVYNGWVKSLGKKAADRQSARPGYSEHQTGLAVDISSVPAKCSLAACFGTTRQGKWLKAKAWKYGFLLRYPSSKEKVTGFRYEPWHFRYIGKSLAAQMHAKNILTLEEFFGYQPAPSYR